MYRVSLRAAAFVLPALLAAAGHGAASSLLVLPAPPDGAAGSSIVKLGDPVAPSVEARALSGPHRADGSPAAEPELLALGRSMVAVGADAIPATREKVASVPVDAAPPKQRPNVAAMPFVIRGGVEGDAFSSRPAGLVSPPVADAAPPEADDDGDS